MIAALSNHFNFQFSFTLALWLCAFRLPFRTGQGYKHTLFGKSRFAAMFKLVARMGQMDSGFPVTHTLNLQTFVADAVRKAVPLIRTVLYIRPSLTPSAHILLPVKLSEFLPAESTVIQCPRGNDDMSVWVVPARISFVDSGVNCRNRTQPMLQEVFGDVLLNNLDIIPLG